MSDLQKDYISSLLKQGIRVDGRKLTEYRKPIKIEYGISSKSAEGSARVIVGGTEVMAGVKLGIDKPYPDMPDEGTIIVNVELLPLSNPEFESGPPGIDSIEIARIVDRGIRESKAIDFKKLCVRSGELVWIVFIDIYPINDDGDLIDVAGLAALAALKDARFPELVGDIVDYKKYTKKKLEVTKLPIPCTVIKIENNFIVDPTIEEEKAIESRLTVTTTEDGKICAMQKGGDNSLSAEDIDKMIDLSLQKSKELRKFLEW